MEWVSTILMYQMNLAATALELKKLNCWSTFMEPRKQLVIIPVFKKGHNTDNNSYRPISHLYIFPKIFEKVLHKRIVNYINGINTHSPRINRFLLCNTNDAIGLSGSVQQVPVLSANGLILKNRYLAF